MLQKLPATNGFVQTYAATPAFPMATPRMGDILIEQGAITLEQLQQALEQQRDTQERIGTILMSQRWATEEQITVARSVQFDVAYVAVAEVTPDPYAVSLISYEAAQQYSLLPLSVESDEDGRGRLRVAMVNPWDIEAIDYVQREARQRIEPLLASEGGLRTALERAYREARGDAHDAAMNDTLGGAHDLDDAALEEGADIDVGDALRQSDQAPIIRFVNTLFSDAVRRRASDIHIEPRKKDFVVRYRVDGQLQAIKTVSRQFLAATTSRIKIMAEMDISERRVPLDGRISLRVEGRGINMRVSTMPTQYGERVVMRILDRGNACLTLDQLGFSPSNAGLYQKLIRQPHGMILVTGPTGSGKTTTLYAALNAVKSDDVNILTAEDPIEYELEGISQSNVNERAGLTFAKQLRAMLRQDPDIVLVGEIRDAETAEIACRAALTGHLVLSTLHCNEAAGAVSRLLDMGVAPFLIASTVIGVCAQRLVRRLCPACRRPLDAETGLIPIEIAEFAAPNQRFWDAAGCPECNDTGSKGRMAVHEVMIVNNEIRRLTMQQAETKVIREAALRGGMIPMIRDGLNKVDQGLTTLDDVQRKIGLLGDE